MRTNHLSSCLVHHFLEKSAELFPDKIAIVHEERRTEFSRINKWANQLAHCLIKSNVSNGDRIVLLCENNLEYIFCYYGILKAGCIAVSLNTDLKPESLAELLKELKSKVSSFHQNLNELSDRSIYHRFISAAFLSLSRDSQIKALDIAFHRSMMNWLANPMKTPASKSIKPHARRSFIRPAPRESPKGSCFRMPILSPTRGLSLNT